MSAQPPAPPPKTPARTKLLNATGTEPYDQQEEAILPAPPAPGNPTSP